MRDAKGKNCFAAYGIHASLLFKGQQLTPSFAFLQGNLNNKCLLRTTPRNRYTLVQQTAVLAVTTSHVQNYSPVIQYTLIFPDQDSH